MTTDYADVNIPKRQQLLRLLSDLSWHEHYELAEVGGVRYSARLLELRRLGYTIETEDSGGPQGKRYRLTSLKAGVPQEKRVKVFLDEHDAALAAGGVLTERAKQVIARALGSFLYNRDRL